MLMIRLSKVGKRNKKMFRLVISEKTKDPFADSLEILGSYNPHTKDLQVKADRIKHWVKQGAGMSDTVTNLLIDHKIIEGKKTTASKITKKRTEKMDKKAAETKKAADDAKAKAEAASQATAEAAAVPAEEVKEEVKTEEEPQA